MPVFTRPVLFGKQPVFFDADPDTGGGSGGDKGKDDKKVVSLSQEALDAMFADRAKRGGEMAIKSLLEKLGLDNEDSLTSLVGKAKEVSDKEKTELQKVQEEMTKLQEKALKAEQEKKDILAQATERLMKAAVLAEAAAQSFRPEAVNDVWLFVDRAKITEKDGDFTGIKEAVQEVAKAKAWMLAEKSRTPGTPLPKSKDGQASDNGQKEAPKRPLRL
jgi:hypothetical protein